MTTAKKSASQTTSPKSSSRKASSPRRRTSGGTRSAAAGVSGETAHKAGSHKTGSHKTGSHKAGVRLRRGRRGLINTPTTRVRRVGAERRNSRQNRRRVAGLVMSLFRGRSVEKRGVASRRPTRAGLRRSPTLWLRRRVSCERVEEEEATMLISLRRFILRGWILSVSAAIC
jgi:hypothetical protein